MLKPSAVFTPYTVPIAKTNVYAQRGASQSKLEKLIDRNAVPLVYGAYGVGKTSMARWVVRDAEREGRLVNVTSVSGKSMADVFAQVLEHIGYTVVRERRRGTSSTQGESVEAGFKAAWPTPLTITMTGKKSTSSSESDEIIEQFVVTSPSDERVLDRCETLGVVLLIDELHKATPSFRENLVDLIKVYSNKGCSGFKLVLLGTAHDANSLVARDEGIDRIVREVELDLMSDEECRFVVEKGMSDLGIEIDGNTTDAIVAASGSAPSVVQYLALEVADAAFKRTPREATSNDVENAIDEYMGDRAARLRDAYQKAISTTGTKRYRTRIIHAVAAADSEYVTMNDIVKHVSEALGEKIRSTSLSGPLRSLKSEEYGRILCDVERDDGTRVWNYTRFSAPGMRAFVRMVMRRESS